MSDDRAFDDRDSFVLRARVLVQGCKIVAIPSIPVLSKQFPLLDAIDRENWDFILTVAGVFIATSRLEQLNLSNSRKQAVLNVIADSLNQWHPDGRYAFEDCKALFEDEFDRLRTEGEEELYIGSDALGLWIVWNILGHEPQNEEEARLQRAVGVLVIGALLDFWDQALQQPG